jgi:predicted esterase
MSGGRYGYAFATVSQFATEVERWVAEHPFDPEEHDARRWPVYSRSRRAFLSAEESDEVLRAARAERLWLVGLLREVARAMHDVEWVESGDSGPGSEVEAIRAVRQWLLQNPEPGESDANGG